MERHDCARWLNLICGDWLFVSAFVWTHQHGEFLNAVIVGSAMVLVAVVSMWRLAFLYTNALLSIWLFVSAWTLPLTAVETFWNHLLVSLLVFALAANATAKRRTAKSERPSRRIALGRKSRPVTAATAPAWYERWVLRLTPVRARDAPSEKSYI
jgi:hypothetical protein